MSRFALVLASVALGAVLAPEAPANISIAYQSSSLYTYKISAVPDFDQKRSGLPNNGNMYCAPTSTLNFAAYVAAHGYPDMNPGIGNWQSANLYDLATFFDSVMGTFMSTGASGGTTLDGMMNGMGAWFQSSHGQFISIGLNASGGSSPRFDTLATFALQKNLVLARIGWYDTSAYPLISRTGGHITCLTRAVRNGSQRGIGLNDPASDDGNLNTQGTFARQNYSIQDESVFVFSGGIPVPRTMSKIVGYGSGYIDGYRVLIPLFGLTTNPLPTLTQVLTYHPYGFGNDAPAPNLTINLAGVAQFFTMHPEALSALYSVQTGMAAPVSTLYEVDLQTGVSTPVASQVGTGHGLAAGRQGLVYNVVNQTLYCRNPHVPSTGIPSVPLPGPIVAMDYDDVHDQVVLLDTTNKKIYRYPASLQGGPTTIPLPSNTTLPGIPCITVNPTNGHAFYGSSGNGKVFEAYLDDAGAAVINPFLLLPAVVGTSGLQFDDLGRLFLVGDGSVRAYSLANGIGQALPGSASPFIGRPSGPQFALPRSRNNFDPATMSTPQEVETVLPTQFAPSVHDCSADINGSDFVDGTDLAALLAAWNTANYDADLDFNGVVNSADLAILLSQWGACPN
ncbi:MAG: hypothetical protein KDA25_07385 [Phycisphaerales bacterium]|nr:hypothetical protein [Phycisphaerales bacterium]